MLAEQTITPAEQRADYVRRIRNLENDKKAGRPAHLGKAMVLSDQQSPTEEDRERQIEQLKSAIAQIDEASVRR
jgi:hypothetical protein